MARVSAPRPEPVQDAPHELLHTGLKGFDHCARLGAQILVMLFGHIAMTPQSLAVIVIGETSSPENLRHGAFSFTVIAQQLFQPVFGLRIPGAITQLPLVVAAKMWGTPNSSRRISTFSAAHRVNDTNNSTRGFMEAQYNSGRFSLRTSRPCEKLVLWSLNPKCVLSHFSSSPAPSPSSGRDLAQFRRQRRGAHARERSRPHGLRLQSRKVSH